MKMKKLTVEILKKIWLILKMAIFIIILIVVAYVVYSACLFCKAGFVMKTFMVFFNIFWLGIVAMLFFKKYP